MNSYGIAIIEVGSLVNTTSEPRDYGDDITNTAKG
ncbi:hypothetical protein ES703_80829 [subsurface metagenome]